MPAIERLGVDTVELPHAPREGRAGCLDQQMIVMVHHTVDMTQPAVAVDAVRQCREKPPPILVIADDPLVGIAAAGQMVHRRRKCKAKRAGHAAPLLRPMRVYKT